jgi:thiaminase/transcriptional activator TenA
VTGLTNATTSRLLLTAAEPAWSQALTMPFVDQVCEDSISDEVFARYLVLELQFVNVAARMLGAAVLRSPTPSALEGHRLTLTALVEDQYTYFGDALGQLGTGGSVVGPRAQAQADQLADRVLDVAEHGSYAELVACMLPSEQLYATWCARAVRTPSRRPVIRQWVALHAEPPFTERVTFLVSQVDALSVDAAGVTQLGSLVSQILELEYRFHQAAFITA